MLSSSAVLLESSRGRAESPAKATAQQLEAYNERRQHHAFSNNRLAGRGILTCSEQSKDGRRRAAGRSVVEHQRTLHISNGPNPLMLLTEEEVKGVVKREKVEGG